MSIHPLTNFPILKSFFLPRHLEYFVQVRFLTGIRFIIQKEGRERLRGGFFQLLHVQAQFSNVAMLLAIGLYN